MPEMAGSKTLNYFTVAECRYDRRFRARGNSVITSPSYPSDYGNNVYCVWTFTNEEGGRIIINFDSFQTERIYDYVQFGTGTTPDPNATLHHGNDIPETFISHGYDAWIIFHSDDSLTRSGFQATVSATDECEYEYELKENEEIVITSPNYPSNYHPNIECTWIIITNTQGGRIRLIFQTFETEDGYDSVRFGSGTTPNSDADVHHGNVIPDDYTSNGGEVWIAFYSDYSVTERGFQFTAFVIHLNCTSDEYICPNNECVADPQLCEGGGYSDLEIVCGDDEYECIDGSCISINQLCNLEQDCLYREDELDCAGEDVNLALKKPAYQSTDFAEHRKAEKGVDGIRAHNDPGRCAHTYEEFEPWFIVDLMKSYRVLRIHLFSRNDVFDYRMIGARMRVGNNENHLRNAVCGKSIGTETGGENIINCPGKMIGRYVSVDIPNRVEYLGVCEIEVYGQDLSNCSEVISNSSTDLNNVPCCAGYESKNRTCEDIDECASYGSLCEHKCINTPGSFYCDCNNGYKLRSDRKSCQRSSVFVAVTQTKKVHYDAALVCEGYNMALVKDDSSVKHQQIKNSVYTSGSFWFDAIISIDGQHVVSSDGTVLEWLNFNRGEPSGDGRCLTMATGNDFLWNDYKCEESVPYICETTDKFDCAVRTFANQCDLICEHRLGNLFCPCDDPNSTNNPCAGVSECAFGGKEKSPCNCVCVNEAVSADCYCRSQSVDFGCIIYVSKCGFNEVLDLTVRDVGLITYLYSWNTRCEWTVKVPRGSTIVAVIEYYNMVGDCVLPRCDIDLLEIHDRTDTGDDKITSICGDETTPKEIVYSSSNIMLITFTNDDMYLQNVFQLVFIPRDILQCPHYIGRRSDVHSHFIEQSGPVVFIDTSSKFTCAGKINKWEINTEWANGSSLLFHPGIYRRQEDNHYVLIGQSDVEITNATADMVTLELSPENFLTFQPGDFLGLMCESSCHIRGTSDTCFQCPECPVNNIRKALIRGNLQEGQTVSVDDVPGAFSLPIVAILQNYCEDGDCSGCGSPRTLTSTAGSVHTTNYLTGDLHYYPDTFCKWTIVAPSSQYIHVKFESFDVPSSHSGDGQRHCASYVALYNGSDVNDIDLMDTFCGSHIPLLSSLSNELTIVFSSDQTTSGRGFYATYHFTDCQGYGMDMSECEHHIHATSECGYFKSSGYPHPYQSNIMCSWSIEVADDDVILFEFLDFNVGDRSCERDLVKVYSSLTADDAYLFHTLCGDEKPSPIISPSSTLYIEFQGAQMSDGASTGFLARYTAIPYQLEIPQQQPSDLHYTCLEDWKLYGRKCYKFYRHDTGLSWRQAEYRCSGEGAHLASILNEDESKFIMYSLINDWWYGDTSTYIGLADEAVQGQYRWTDGNPMSYADWERARTNTGTNQPDGARFEQCTKIELSDFHLTDHWHDISCVSNTMNQYICKRDAVLDGLIEEVDHYQGISVYACDDDSWGRFGDVCFKPKSALSSEASCEHADLGFTEISLEELMIVKYYLRYVLSHHSSGYILVGQANIISADVIKMIVDDCRNSTLDNTTVCSVGDHADSITESLNSSNTCLVFNSSEWSLRLISCDHSRIKDILCVKEASVYEAKICDGYNYQCGNSDCIHNVYVCDGIDDCGDGSDEQECDMAGPCTSDSFQCSNGRCIPVSFYCDFIDQCGDNSDEETCVYRNCTADQFMCDNGQCVDISNRCDFISDCIDGSDEVLCDVCKGFLCYYLDCLPNRARCDGEKDCAGSENEDEMNCIHRNNTHNVDIGMQLSCGSNGFKCNNGRCIDRKWMCIYDFDKYGYQLGCRDVTHLRQCEHFSCPPTMFKCPDSYCIPLYRRCNGIFDCPYGLDEHNCESYNCSGNYRCHGMKNCIPLTERCDGIKQCLYGDDELLCDDYCPDFCECHGSAIDCTNQEIGVLPVSVGQNTKKLNLSGTSFDIEEQDFEDLRVLAEL
ncbi:uncharacterized protein [Ptychodera flava]|uniref:uncharacterized protein n=1 Tax=Ptychodera flava TaxID=63121 RepID=UPI003969E6D7